MIIDKVFNLINKVLYHNNFKLLLIYLFSYVNLSNLKNEKCFKKFKLIRLDFHKTKNFLINLLVEEKQLIIIKGYKKLKTKLKF